MESFHFEYDRFMAKADKISRPFVISEFNADGDVTGPFEQAEQLADFYRRLPAQAPCITGVTFYQFRDRGRLGLEIEDPNNPGIGCAQPILEEYRNIMAMEPYLPVMTVGEKTAFPAPLRWGGAEDADGLAIPLQLEQNPVFCEITFSGEDVQLNLMMEINGRWFYKKPGVKTIDLIPAFFHNKLRGKQTLNLNLFAPPPEGVNDPAQGKDWETNYRTKLHTPPNLRIRYAPPMPIGAVM
jgi:hypothetical protein